MGYKGTKWRQLYYWCPKGCGKQVRFIDRNMKSYIKRMKLLLRYECQICRRVYLKEDIKGLGRQRK